MTEGQDMSQEGGIGIALAERFFGLLLTIIGALTVYETLTSTSTLGAYTGFFSFLSLILVVLGIILLTAKIE
jgi:hypothetical protein